MAIEKESATYRNNGVTASSYHGSIISGEENSISEINNSMA